MNNYYPKLEPDTCYHIYNRGNNRENIFYKAGNYAYFLQKYARYMSGVLDTYVYNLLPNHFHIVARVKLKEEIVPMASAVGFPTLEDLERLSVDDIVSEQFRRFFMAYAKAINKQEGRVGSLFQKNFKRRPVLSDGHFQNLIYYVHTNAQLHGICDDFRDWPHSSYASMLSDSNTRLLREAVLGRFNCKAQFEQYHKEYVDLKNIEELIIED